MNWSMQSHRHYSAEHLHKPDKKQLGQSSEKDFLPLRKKDMVKRRSCFQH